MMMTMVMVMIPFHPNAIYLSAASTMIGFIHDETVVETKTQSALEIQTVQEFKAKNGWVCTTTYPSTYQYLTPRFVFLISKFVCLSVCCCVSTQQQTVFVQCMHSIDRVMILVLCCVVALYIMHDVHTYK